MAQVLVRNLDEATVTALKARAASRGNSLEQELREILTDAARPTREEVISMLNAIRSMTPRPLDDVDIAALIREDRERS